MRTWHSFAQPVRAWMDGRAVLVLAFFAEPYRDDEGECFTRYLIVARPEGSGDLSVVDGAHLRFQARSPEEASAALTFDLAEKERRERQNRTRKVPA